MNSLMPEKLQEIIDKAMKIEKKYIKRKNIIMKVLPEFKDLFIKVKEVLRNRKFLIILGENKRFYTMVRNADQRRMRKAEKMLNQHWENGLKYEMEIVTWWLKIWKTYSMILKKCQKKIDKNSEILSFF